MDESEEDEANLFARLLLMPDYLVAEWVSDHPIDLFDDSVKALAKAFDVSVPLATLRLNELGYL